MSKPKLAAFPFSAPSCRGALLLLLAGSLAACGGQAEQALTDLVACASTNCKSSRDVVAEDLRQSGTLRREGGRVSVDVGLSYRANLFTVVRLEAPDAMWLMPGQLPLTSGSDRGSSLLAELPDSRDDWTLRLQHRGIDYESTVRLPAPVQIQSAAPSTVQRTQGRFASTLSAAAGLKAQLTLTDADCQLVDGRTVRWQEYRNGPTPTLQGSSGAQVQFSVDTEHLQSVLDQTATSVLGTTAGKNLTVKQCRMSLVWEFANQGTVATGLSRYSLLLGISQVRQVVSYVNDR